MANDFFAEIEAWVRIAKAKPDYTELISDRKGEPDNQKLYDQVKADAQKKFDVYPSAVANGWVVQEYKRRGGTYSKPVAKGDLPGHEFRGNQYASAGGTAQITSESQTAPLNAASAAKDLATKANDLYEKNQIDKFDKTMPASVASKIGKDHWDMAIEHQKEAERLSNEDETHLNSEIGHADASDEHYNAAKRWGVVADMLNGTYGPSQLNVDSAIAAAKEASGSATDASSNIIPEAAHEDTIAQNGGPNVAKPLYGFSVKNAGNIKSDVEASYIASALHEHLVIGAGHPDDTEVRTPADYKVGASQHYQLAQYYAGKAQSGPQKAEYQKAADAHIAAYKACEKAASAGTKEPSKASVAAVADTARVADRASFNLGETYMNNRK